MLLILFLLLVLLPVIELSVLIRVGEVLGSWTTIALVLLTAIVGVSLVRSQGLHTLMQVQQKLARGEVPGQEIVEGMMLALAGVLLLIPGFVTDFIGLLLLTPLSRVPIASYLYKRLQLKVIAGDPFFGGLGPRPPSHGEGDAHGRDEPGRRGTTLEGDYEHKPETDAQLGQDASKPASELKSKPEPKSEPEPKSKPEPKPDSEPKSESTPKPEPKPKQGQADEDNPPKQ
ncbi:FxsA family protein [Shewanella salipaludis]|uniref:FxsA family protein n=1 Tax=Shewanella salipaludis TaxID=2723052 RepID=A0A972JM60_9GAMM|nr:FxsA family protein [Shewanella salipaludis]NMH66924.1 FxsA family protein [Shewanella salipaludis]